MFSIIARQESPPSASAAESSPISAKQRGIELLKDSGLAVSNLLWAGGFTGSEGHTYRESLDDTADAIRLAAQLGAQCLVVYSGARAGHTHNHARRLLTDALSKLAPLAAEHKVTLALEPMHPDLRDGLHVSDLARRRPGNRPPGR